MLVQAPSAFNLSCLTDSSSAWHCLWRGEKGEEKTAQNPWRPTVGLFTAGGKRKGETGLEPWISDFRPLGSTDLMSLQINFRVYHQSREGNFLDHYRSTSSGSCSSL
ncbi:Protein Topaz1 [Manis pentadactyla]|nr:Protein Topaz1 [Manis pentadactyla]